MHSRNDVASGTQANEHWLSALNAFHRLAIGGISVFRAPRADDVEHAHDAFVAPCRRPPFNVLHRYALCRQIRGE